MKLLKTLFLLLLLVSFSCSEKENTEEEQQQTEGAVSFTFADGRSFIVENVNATVTNLYSFSDTKTITITGTAGGSGELTLTLVDKDNDFKAVVNENEFPFGDTSKSFYATIRYVDNSSTFTGGAGTFDILDYEENTNSGTSKLSGIFNTANNSTWMLGNISELVIRCLECQ